MLLNMNYQKVQPKHPSVTKEGQDWRDTITEETIKKVMDANEAVKDVELVISKVATKNICMTQPKTPQQNMQIPGPKHMRGTEVIMDIKTRNARKLRKNRATATPAPRDGTRSPLLAVREKIHHDTKITEEDSTSSTINFHG